jgi:ABC-2 type transport system permease protein
VSVLSGPGFWNLLRWELHKLVRRRSSYIGVGLVALYALVMLGGFGLSQWRSMQRWAPLLGVDDPKDLINGPFFANFMMHTGFYALVPLLTVTVAAGQIAGEARDGTLRALLVRPIGRGTLLAAKSVATFIWMMGVIFVMLGLGLLLGWLRYGGGDMLVFVWELRGDGPWFATDGAWLPTLLMCALGAGASMLVLISLTMLLSTVTEHPAAAVVGALGAYLISTVIQRLPETILGDDIRQLLPTSHMNYWHEFYRWAHPTIAMDTGRIATDVVWCGAITVACFVAAYVVFRRRDVTA